MNMIPREPRSPRARSGSAHQASAALIGHARDPFDDASLLAEVRYWDELIDRERGRSKLQVLARLEEQRAWALVRLLNLTGGAGPAGPCH